MMKNYIQTFGLALALLLFTACGGGSSGNATQDTAIDKLEAYANSNGTTEVPTLQDYLDAGVTGIDSDTQLSEINQVVEGLVAEDVDTTEEVQTLADALGVEVPEETVTTTPTRPTPPPPVVVTPPPVVVTPDTTPPVISITGANPTIVTQGNVYSDEGATAIDDVDGPVPLMATVIVDTTTLGSYTATYTATDAAGNTATAIRIVEVVAAVTITHNGTTYGTVTSPYTGKIWLDRNLGAAQVCTSFNDTACYGDYYQWGRNADGHEDSGSTTTLTLATDVNASGTAFIRVFNIPLDWTSIDGTGVTRSANWSKTDGSSVCPLGFRVPNFTELRAETLDNGVIDIDTAFSNFLALPSAGDRDIYNGSMENVGLLGQVWSTSVETSSSYFVAFDSSNAYWFYDVRAFGFSVRCIKD